MTLGPVDPLGLARVLDAIGRVHGDGPLPNIPVLTVPAGNMSANGDYLSGRPIRLAGTLYGGAPERIRVSATKRIGPKGETTTPHLTFAHEIGHYLDNAGIGRTKKSEGYPPDGQWPTQKAARANVNWTPANTPAEAAMQKVMGALVKSRAATELRDMANQAAAKGYIEIPRRLPEGFRMGGDKLGLKPLPPYQYAASPAWFKYAHSDIELWARAYAQYIAVRSGDLAMMAQLRMQQETYTDAAAQKWQTPELAIPVQWQDDDFEPIAQAIDELFAALGWKK